MAPVESIEAYLARQAVEDKGHEQESSSKDDPDPPPPSARGASGLMEQAVHEDFHGKTFSNESHRSTSDPDSRLYKKSAGQEAHPRFLVHDLVDVRTGVILDRRASRASGTAEREVSLQQLAAIRFRHPSITIRTLSADKAYGSKEYLASLKDLGITPLVSLKSLELDDEPVYKRKSHNPRIQAQRANKIRLIQISNAAKQIHGGYRHVQRMRVRCEHGFAEAKNVHGMDRANSRGLDRMQEQATWTGIVQNLKRLCRFKKNRPVAGSLICANPVADTAQERTTISIGRLSRGCRDFCNRWIWPKANFSPDF